MVGAIVKSDILAHPLVTIRCFGWRIFLRAVFAGRGTTFLSLLTDSEVLQSAGEGVPEFVARCVELELKVSRFYESLSRRFAGDDRVRHFFSRLAVQEAAHAELLELAETAASRERWDESMAAPWRDVVPGLERKMDRVLSSLGDINNVRQAFEQVIHVESSEINDLFGAVIAASDSCFVKRMRAFRNATLTHLRFICRTIAELEPTLVPASLALQKRSAA